LISRYLPRRYRSLYSGRSKTNGNALVLIASLVLVFSICLIIPKWALAQGGCGSVCVPLEALDPEKIQVGERQSRISIITEYAEFDNFREDSSSIFNPGGNEADISQTTLFIDYGAAKRFTTSLLVPYVNKRQTTNKFGVRVAEGIGDIALFGRYEVIFPTLGIGPSISLGLGLKFPTGSIDEPGNKQRLPPAFQVGSGAYDLFPTISYYQAFDMFSLFGNSFVRIPLGENKRGYEFGREYEVHFGIQYLLPIWHKKVALLASLDYLFADHDKDSESILPPKLLKGSKVLNTGGQFLDITPGLLLRLTPNFVLQSRFFIPVIEDWNGFRPNNVGQVAPDITFQFTISYTII